MNLDDLENIMRKQANKARKQPEDELWERIGQQMKRPSERRKNHFYLSYVVAAILVGLLAIPVYLMLKTDFFTPNENQTEPSIVYDNADVQNSTERAETEYYEEQEEQPSSLNKSKRSVKPKISQEIEEVPIAINEEVPMAINDYDYFHENSADIYGVNQMEMDYAPVPIPSIKDESILFKKEKAEIEEEKTYAVQEIQVEPSRFESDKRVGNAAVLEVGYDNIALNQSKVKLCKINSKQFQYQDATGTYQFTVTPIKNGNEIVLTPSQLNNQGFFNLNTSTGRLNLNIVEHTEPSDTTNANLQLMQLNLQQNQQWIQNNFFPKGDSIIKKCTD